MEKSSLPINTPPTPHNVLFLSSYHIEGKGTAKFVKGLQSAFDEDTSVSINIFSEYMDLMRFKGKAHEQQLLELYRAKYGNKKIDIIISHASPALDFLLKHRDTLFPGTPVVFALVSKSIIQKRTIPSNFIGIVSGPEFASTLDVALNFIPSTENALIVGGTSSVDRQYFSAAKNQLKPFEDKVKITYLNQIAMKDMLEQVAKQQKKTVIIYALLQQDGTGKRFLPNEVSAIIAKVANVPVFALSETQMSPDHGLVGGMVMSLDMIGKTSARTALEVIKQNKPVEFATYYKGAHAYIFDWRQLKRWNIDKDRLPPGSVVWYKDFTIWEQYNKQIIGIATLIFLETLLIALLFINRSRRIRTERFLRESEEEIRKMNQDLELRVHQRTAELKEANKELEDFVYSVSHDLRAPLRSVSGFAEIIVRRHKSCLNEEGRHYFDNIIKASSQMGQLIDDLLKFSRLGRKAIKLEAVSLDEALKTAMEILSDQIDETGARVNLHEPMPVIHGDATLVNNIFQNLLENAMKYHKPDEPPIIDIRSEVKCEYAVISITDNGIGIEPEYHETIFNIFQRLHSQEEYPGTGIGLAAAKKAIQMMKGEVRVESEPGKGSVFKVKLLLAKIVKPGRTNQ